MLSGLLKATLWRTWIIVGLGVALTPGCVQQNSKLSTSSSVIIQQSVDAGIGERIRAAATIVPAMVMKRIGLAGVMGGIHVKLFRNGAHDIRLPMPQSADCQIPIWYGISTAPKQALVEYRLQDRGDGNIFVNVKLSGMQDQEITIEWAAVILVAKNAAAANRTRPEPYVRATPCVQSTDEQIKVVADMLWPGTGKKDEYARNVQGFIRNMKQKEQPKSLDALGILKSGQRGICTANANLACAFLRAKRVPCRSIAVIPPISRRLEMHRIVEYFENDNWVTFDPSLLHADIPMEPWQNIIMAKTTIADEEKAMKPRIGTMLGCPFGQELEISRVGLNLFGNDFFWTLATPLAEFAVSDEAVRLTEEAWRGYLKIGMVSAAQISAASARNLEQYVEAMKKN